MSPTTRLARLAPAALLTGALVLGTAGTAEAQIWPIDPAAPVSATATATQEARIDRRLDALMAYGGFGSHYSLNVIDVESGRVIDSHSPGVARTPASNVKLFTAVAALDALGAETRFVTKVARLRTAKTVTLVGGGDARVTTTKLRSLATQTAARLRATGVPLTNGVRVVTVALDDTRYSGATKLSSWREDGYDLSTIQPIRSIMRTPGVHTDAAASAASYLVTALDDALPSSWVVRYGGRAKRPAGSVSIAYVQSSTVASLVKYMLVHSNNQLAEGFNREVALKAGLSGTFANGSTAVKAAARRYGVPTTSITLVDGSGLSPVNRVSAASFTALLREIAGYGNGAKTGGNPKLRPILYSDDGLPLAGMTGTLSADYDRFQDPAAICAVGKVTAKTGTLEWERALSGFTVGADNRLKAFSVVVNGLSTDAISLRARITLDRAAAIVNGC